MIAQQRKNLMVQHIIERGAASISELSARFGVSSMTVRRDLSQLARQGLIRKAHGGALSVELAEFEPSFQEKDVVNSAEREGVGAAAAAMIGPRDTVFLTTGTTTMQIVRQLGKRPAGMPLTVVTNSLNNAYELCKLPAVRVVVLGGEVRKKSYAMTMPDVEDLIRRIYVDKLFLGVNGISREYGLTVPNPAEAQVCQLVMRRSRRTIVVADHSKFARVTFAHIADLDGVDTVITDDGVSPEDVAQLQAQSIRMLTV
jgi:DeoR/GlpR family transcriptional regulator of sugar metabolism